MQHSGILKIYIYPLERVHVVTGFIIYTYVCNKNSLFVNPPKYTLLPLPPPRPAQKKICMNHCSQMLLGVLHFPKSI